MARILAFGLLLLMLGIGDGRAQFTGQFDLGPAGCENTGTCILTYDFWYRDPYGVMWQAAAKNRTDGASIPYWAQPIVGKPFDRTFVRAAVIHDHYCDRHVRPWRATHRVFYDALLESGVEKGKAKLMYFAVYLGGPKWIELIPGKNCGPNCVFKVETGIGTGTGARTVEMTSQYLKRAATYDQADFQAEVKEAEAMIAQLGDGATLEMLEQKAAKARPGDMFYRTGDQIDMSVVLAR